MNRKQRRANAKLASPPQLLATAVRFHQAGQLVAAEACYRQALATQPNLAEAHFNLGNALAGQGKLDEAIAAYRQAIGIKPDYADSCSNLGNALAGQGKLDEAVAAYRQAIGIKPDYAMAYSNLGVALAGQGKLDEAIAAHRRVIEIKPDYAMAYSNLGNALFGQGKLDDAIAAHRQAIGIRPDYAEAYYNLGIALAAQNKLDEAIAAYRRAIGIKSDYAEAYSNLGAALAGQGKLDQAIAAHRRAIGIKPDAPKAFSNLLVWLNCDDKLTNEDLFAAHREWDERYGQRVPLFTAHTNDRDPARRLRIAYLSPDFREHSVAFFVEPLLRAHDRQKVEVFCYSDVARPDEVTTRLQSLADRWRVTVGLTDTQLTERIRTDGVDILVDLAGHTVGNRLLVFARKPAPVQATWLGYLNTTGLKAMDYRLVDAVTDPPGEADAWASETLVRLSGGFLCYGGLRDGPEPASAPCLTTGTVTFGSFNHPAKLSTATLDAWAELLRRLPQAHLLLNIWSADAATRALFLDRLGERGVPAEQVELLAWRPGIAEHLTLYHRVDIALDPFPYNGGATTCHALWMGVPAITLRGHRHSGRVGASLLTQVGLTDLIADSIEEYVEIAVTLAGNRERLDELHRLLRSRVAASPLCDASAFASKMEAAFRTMWRRWCQG